MEATNPENTAIQGDLLQGGADLDRAVVHEPLYFHLSVNDPEVIAAVSEFPQGAQRTEFLNTCIRIGVMAIRSARGVIDGDAIHRASDNLIANLKLTLQEHGEGVNRDVAGTLRNYFHPESGSFPERVNRLTKDDGELASVIRKELDTVETRLSKTFDAYVGARSPLLEALDPKESNALLAAMRNTVDVVLAEERKRILAEFSLDNADGSLARLLRELTETHGNLTVALKTDMESVVKEFSLDHKDSALSRLVSRVETAHSSITQQFSLDSENSALSRLNKNVLGMLEEFSKEQRSFQDRVIEMVSSLQAKKQARAQGTLHGADFEVAVGEKLRELTGESGDLLEDCGTMSGTISRSKVGDFAITLSPDCNAAGARIVVEAKEDASYTLATTIAEADEARRNRGAMLSIFVHSRKTVPNGIKVLERYGNDIVCVWDAEDAGNDVILKCAFSLAKAMATKVAIKGKTEAASFAMIDKAIEAMRGQIEGFVEIRTTSTTMRNGIEKIDNRARIMHEALSKNIDTLTEQLLLVKDSAVASSN
jgi:hypothetical protein